MRAYLISTAVLFGLIVGAHVARLMAEGTHVLEDPFFSISTLLAVGMVLWAIFLIIKGPPGTNHNPQP